MASAARSDAERRRRLRESLKHWYDVKDDDEKMEPEAAPQPAAPVSADPERDAMNIDSSLFSASKYTTAMLQKKSLAEVVQVDNHLRRQVKELDTNLKELVYDNYSKFISAADTIRQVRTNVVEMDTRLEALGVSVSAMDSVSQTVTQELAKHRERIESVLSANNALRNLQFLIKLPDVLRRAIACSRYTEGVKYWVAGDAVLAKYAHIPAFRETHQTSRLIAEDMLVSLSDSIMSRCLEGLQIPETARKAETRRAAAEGVAKPQLAPAGKAPSVGCESEARSAVTAGLTAAMEALRLLASTSIDLRRIAEQHPEAIRLQTDPSATIARDVYAAVSQRALSIFERGVNAAIAAFEEEVGKRASVDCLEACHTDDFADAVVMNLERRPAKDALDTIHKHVLSLRAVVERFISAVGQEALPGVIPSDVVMSAAQPLLFRLLDTYQTVLGRSFATIVTNVAGAIARKALISKGSGESIRTVTYAVVNALGVSAVDFSGGVIGIARDNLSSHHNDHLRSFESMVSNAVLEGLRGVHDNLRAFCDPAAMMSAASAESDPFALALALSAITGHIGSNVLLRLPDRTALPAIDETLLRGLRERFDDCSRRFASSAIIVGAIKARRDSIVPGRAAEPVQVAAGTAPPPSPVATALVSVWTSMHDVCDGILSSATIGNKAPAKSTSASYVHRRTGSNAGSASAASRNSGDHGSRSARSNPTSKSITVPEHIRRDATFTSEVERLFAKPAGSALCLRPSAVDAPHITECLIVATLLFWLDVARDALGLRAQEFYQLQVDATYIMAVVQQHVQVWYRREDRWAPLLVEIVTSAYEHTTERSALADDTIRAAVQLALDHSGP